MTIPKSKFKWPETLSTMPVEHFLHGDWAQSMIFREDTLSSVSRGLGHMTAKELGEECGTVGCLVGNVRYAFGLRARPPLPRGLARSPKAARAALRATSAAEEFMHWICEAAGHPYMPASPHCGRGGIWEHASDLFEGGTNHDKPMTCKHAAELYEAALEHFGYTEDDHG